MFSLFKLFASPSKLRKKGVIGMNRRNGAYIARYNDRSKYPLVDDKLKTKIIAQAHGATVPKLIGVIAHQAEVKRIHKMVKSWPGLLLNQLAALVEKAFWLFLPIKTECI